MEKAYRGLDSPGQFYTTHTNAMVKSGFMSRVGRDFDDKGGNDVPGVGRY